MVNNFDKVCLGTVKLGMPQYGFSSDNSQSDIDTLGFLKQVESMGINQFDTSPRYGESESLLGQFVSQSTKKPIVSSKIDNLKGNDIDTSNRMLESVKSSLSKLHLDKLFICYLHQNDINIISDPYVHDGLILLKERGLISNTGVSVYSFEECEYALGCGIFDYIQVPINVFDVSFYDRYIKENKSEIRFAARSLLLQGIVANRAQIISRISNYKEILLYLNKLDNLAIENSITTLQMSLAFVFSLNNIDQYLIGSTSLENLNMNKAAFDEKLPSHLFELIYDLASETKDWSNPRSWE